MTDARRRNRGRRVTGSRDSDTEAREYLLGKRDHCWRSLLGWELAADLRHIWDAMRDETLATWAVEHPGTRPPAWWHYDAPEPRLRVGGIGSSFQEILGRPDSQAFGIPAWWPTDFQIGHCGRGVRFDPTNPPLFESQATYLRRHKLLLPGELWRLGPADYEPEKADQAEVRWMEPAD